MSAQSWNHWISYLFVFDEKFSPFVAAALFVNPEACETLADVSDDSNQELQKQTEECLQSSQSHLQQEDQSEDIGENNTKEPEEPDSLNRGPPQAAWHSNLESIRKSFYSPSLVTQEQGFWLECFQLHLLIKSFSWY